MYLKEKIETFNLKTPYHVSHNANRGLRIWGSGSGRIELVDKASVTLELTFEAMAFQREDGDCSSNTPIQQLLAYYGEPYEFVDSALEALVLFLAGILTLVVELS